MTFNAISKTMQANQARGNMTAVWYDIGRIIRLVFDFE